MIVIEIADDLYCFKCLGRFLLKPIKVVKKLDHSIDYEKTEVVYKHELYAECADKDTTIIKTLEEFLISVP